MKLFSIVLLCFVMTVRTDLWYQYVDDYENPVPVNTYIPQVFHQHTINTIPHYPYRWPVQDTSAANDNIRNILTEQNFHLPKGNSYAQYSQSEIVGDPFRTCAENEFQCSSPKQCIPIKKRCNNYVDCVDVSDEINCTCTLRLTPEKLCDFLYDCPNGEDELGCFGCGEDQYSCYLTETEYKNSGSGKDCYNSNQKCDKQFNCLNGNDENGCARILKEVISPRDSLVLTTENGVLHYLHQGQFYPVCVDELGWSVEVCRHMLPVTNFRNAEIKYEVTEYNGTYVKSQFKRGAQHSIKLITFVNECPGVDFNSRNVLIRVNCLSNSSCGSYRDEDGQFSRIAGGYEAILGSNPWLVGLFVNGDFRCGGNIIGTKWILTAAHCLYDDGKRLSMYHYVEVRAGIVRLSSFSSNQQAVRVARGVIHENFNKKTYENDIALLELESALTLNHLVQPICLPTAAHVGDSDDRGWIWGPEHNSVCKIAGWGSHTHHGPSPVDRQMEVNVPIVSTCDPKNNKVICAGFQQGGFDTCAGDSGGPLVCQSKTNKQDVYLAGIVSSGFNPEADESQKTQCGEKNTYGTYTGVTWYILWIESNQNEMAQNETHGRPFREICPGVKCSSSPNFCAFRNGFPDCIDGQDER